jgi:uncharacterized protein DUF4382
MRGLSVCLAVLLLLSSLLLVACGGSSPGTVNLSLSDPPTCMAPQGPYMHVYVTVQDVQIHQSSTASNNDAGWIDLAPQLKNNPVQVDLLGTSNQCFLAMLGSAGIQPGSYQQLRVILANNGSQVNNNKCGVAANCVVLAADPLNPQTLQLSSEAQTGIKIPSGQIAGGQFTIGSGETKDLNIDFNACASIVVQGSGQFRLKPVLHAGEVALQSSSTAISGMIVDNGGLPIVGGNTVVALEQNVGGIDRVIMETVPNSAGGFSFCPVPPGSYEIVATAINGAGVSYAATVITGVQPGNNLGKVPLTPVGLPASINGQLTSSNGSAGVAVDVTVSALQSISASTQVTVPLAQQSASTATLSTSNGTCPAGTDCASYTFSLPASNPSIGAVNLSGDQTPAAPGAGAVTYTVDGLAFVLGTNTANCTQPEQQAVVNNVTAGNPFSAGALAFTGCN